VNKQTANISMSGIATFTVFRTLTIWLFQTVHCNGYIILVINYHNSITVQTTT